MIKYDKYKDSGVDWLGEIPEHWEVRRIKDVVKVNPSTLKNVKNKNSLIEFLPMSNVNEITGTIKEYNFEPYENIKQGYTAFKNEDVLFAKITPCMENGNCVIVDGLQKNLGFGSTEFIVFRTDRLKLTNRHIYQFLRNARFLKKAENFMIGAAGQRRISSEYLKIHPIAIPPLPEQTAITTYLDSKTSAIDRKVTLLEQKITHYQQLRKSLINETVCRGLNKTVKLKDSGIECLPADQAGIGKIPEHWEVKRMKDVIFKNDGGVWGDFSDKGTIVLRSTEIDLDGSWKLDNPARILLTEKEVKSSQLIAGDLLITKSSGSELHIGKTALVDKKIEHLVCCYSNFMQRIRPSNIAKSKYLFYVLNSAFSRYQFILLSKSTTGLGNLSAELLNHLILFFPLPSEQTAIALFLDEKTQKIDSIVSNIKTQIQTLKELRKTLINDVVTGKIKVSEL